MVWLGLIFRGKVHLDYIHCSVICLVEMPLLLSAVAGVLVMHRSLGSAALDTLASIGVMDAKLGVPLLLAILFYNNIFTRNDFVNDNFLVSFLFRAGFALHLM